MEWRRGGDLGYKLAVISDCNFGFGSKVRLRLRLRLRFRIWM